MIDISWFFINVFSPLQHGNKVVNLGFMYSMMLLPAFPRMVWVLNIEHQTMSFFSKRERKTHTLRPKDWNIESDVPVGRVWKNLANKTSSCLLYRIFFSGAGGNGSSLSVRLNSCLCLLQYFIQEALEWCGAFVATSFQNWTISKRPWVLTKNQTNTLSKLIVD